ncbi:MAG TPA: bifunctional phosphopantothenoylcysteine decarboxylase/phosphopantothenate--cysteine ligase CoaBC [Clostridiaceae bacterium]|nr:bifunctional phosphopantothenoylcysteine decarboxylase/phosphopantothenate--cysteine ligase CoaBC [Clostridiaceae bacterium]
MENKKTVVIGVCGGIAVYKALDIISALKKKGLIINVIMTQAAQEFVSPLSFQTMSQNLVSLNMFVEPKAWEIQHVSLAQKADVMLIVPATANFIGKMSNGIADDLLTTTVMATKAPILIAPAMNTGMYTNSILQDNIAKLRTRGCKFVDPSEGRLACGDTGIGKLADVEKICDCVMKELYDIKDLKGKKVLVTAGPTIAPIDPVRYITNRSTGKMGYAIAEEAAYRGAEVVLVSGPAQIKPPYGVELINVKTTEDMYNAVTSRFCDADIVIKAAAVADYKPKTYSDAKIKKASSDLSIEFVKDLDILKKLGEMKTDQILVGFAAESHDLLINAQGKLEKKNLDYIVANDITKTGFASDDNKVTILRRNGDPIYLESMAKRKVARELFNLIVKNRE